MTPSQNILVAIDFSESSMLALTHARRLAEHPGARLHLCHITPGAGIDAPVSLGMNIPDEFPEAKEARAQLQHVRALLGPAIDVEVHVRIGEPVATLLALIQELKPDIFVVGSHGKGMLKRALLGSVSTAMAQRSPVPVLVVPAPGREAILHAPEPAPEPELPAVGQAVAPTGGIQTADSGIAGVGGMNVRLR
jgi:nucleotide-binding universal stress UspA family protein